MPCLSLCRIVFSPHATIDGASERERADVVSKPLPNINFKSSNNFPGFLIMQPLDKATIVTDKSVFVYQKCIDGVVRSQEVNLTLVELTRTKQ